MNERYIDVDLTTADRCPGCPECDEDLAQRLEAARIEDEFGEYREAVPLWAGMNVYDAPPMQAAREYQPSIIRAQRGR